MLVEAKGKQKEDGGNATQYFYLEREARQGDPISVYIYIFILVLELLSVLARNNKDIKGINCFDNFFMQSLCRSYNVFKSKIQKMNL